MKNEELIANGNLTFMKIFKRLIISMVAMMVLSSCVWFAESEPVSESMSFDFVNESDQQISVIQHGYFKRGYIFKLSSFRSWPDHMEKIIQPGECVEFSSFIVGEGIDKTTQILIFKQSTIEEYGRYNIMKNDIYDKRYIISYREVEAGLKIVYTGD